MRTLPEAPPAPHGERRRTAVAAQLRRPAVLRPVVAASALFFTFTSIFSFVTYRLAEAPFDYGTVTTSLLFLLWAMGAVAGLALAALGLGLAGLARPVRPAAAGA